uniref:Phospholipid/glycerol acyltransferase domain-containing protein n=1 Tax=Parascaris univalens TaxID=6257 RepID=A0A915BPN5_PARUN
RMVLSSVVAANEMRAALPASYLSLSMVPFASISLGMGALSWFLPRRVFLAVDNFLYSSYMRMCLFVFENVAATRINFYGDIESVISQRESAIVLSNHQSNVDWVVITMLANRQQGSECGLRFMMKYAIHYVPLFGWYTFQHGFIYVRRFGNVVWSTVERQLSFLKALNEPFWLLIFPEGTRFSPKKRAIIDSSRLYCESIGIPAFDNLLTPRTAGFILALTYLRDSIDAIYDVTIAYEQSRGVGREKCAPDMFEFVCSTNPQRTLHIHVRRFPVDALPDDQALIKRWLIERYQIKNGMLEAFYKGEELPDLSIANAPRVSFALTIPPSLFFLSALIAPFFSKTVRSIYLITLCSSPVLILWLRLRGCV